MRIYEILTETPSSDQAIRQLALKTLKQICKLSVSDLKTAVLEHRNSQGITRFYPIAYRETPFPDLVIGLMSDRSSPCLIQLKLPANKTNLPSDISYIIAYPIRREYRYPENPSFETMMEIAERYRPRPELLVAALENDRSTFVHEFVHYWDYSHARAELQPTSSDTIEEYYNTPLERNAYYQEVMMKVDKKPKVFFEQPFKQFMQKVFKMFDQQFLTHLNEDNRRRIISRLYAVWSAQQNS